MNRESSGMMDIHVNHNLSKRQSTFRDHFFERSETDVFAFSKIEMRNKNIRSMQ
ncbi:MAG TPA: hypothetical protein PK926_16535 [Spirochaetota bacterium]|nr:hypothetical protein [Spirochaetota bacterium]HPI90661.1 hypothetical protein [Spirochaetota bacterium]HPR49687.1 hypothetical protein [Spirochaetota bacterium]